MNSHPDDELDKLLDALTAGTGAGDTGSDPELARLAEAARMVRASAQVGPSAATRARHVRALMEEAGKLAGRQAVGRPRKVHRWRRVVASLAAAMALGVAAVPAAGALAANAQPGDALYGTKLAVEKVQLVVQRDPAKQVSLRLELTERRMAEASRLLAAGKNATAAAILTRLTAQETQIETTLAGLQARGKASPELVRRVGDLVERHLANLSALAERSGCNAGRAATPHCTALRNAQVRSAQILTRLGRRPPGPSGGRSGGPVPHRPGAAR